MSFLKTTRKSFRLTGADWRAPQLGALGALLGHWTTDPFEPALISLPTGTGKTGVALAAAFLAPQPPRSILVVVPSVALREQTVEQFQDLALLQRLGAIPTYKRTPLLKVHEITGHATDWSKLKADVVVAIPASISPSSKASVSVPPKDYFDLVIMDEAHHAPSTTWMGILNHLDYRNAVLLTATPFRLDRKPVPGARVFHYPLRQAIEENFYKPIRPLIVPRPDPNTHESKDTAILDEVVRLLGEEGHATSAMLVRAATIERAVGLAARYQAAGIGIEALTQNTSADDYKRITSDLADGTLRAVAVVGMLGEGYDLPRLRIVAYHDKHKSMPATVQLVGRLARVSEEFPQESVLVTVNDTDVYPELKSVVQRLYEEDADWATVLPGIVDAEVNAERESRKFVDELELREGELDPVSLHPMPTPTVLEIESATWTPLDDDHALPEALHVGQVVAGARILTALVADGGSMIVLVTRRRSVPKWSADLGVENVEYGITVVSFRSLVRTDTPSLLFVDAADGRIAKAVRQALLVPDDARAIDPERLDGYLQSLPRTSISSIGMRNLLAGTRGTTYKTRAGSSTDTDLHSSETTQSALGHIMMQIQTDGGGSTSVGGAFEKGKIWQRRYKPLVDYASWITEAAQLLWFPRTGPSQLIPQVSRSKTLEQWPSALAFAVEPNPALALGGYQLFDQTNTLIGALEDFELHAGVDPTGAHDLPAATATELPIVGVMADRQAGTAQACWLGKLLLGGRVEALTQGVTVKHGYVAEDEIQAFLEHYPPIVYFASGEVVQGHEIFDTREGSHARVDPSSIEAHDWAGAGVDLSAETRKTATAKGIGISIHEEVENYLQRQPKQEKYRWVICNDGTGEIADHLVIEYAPGGPVRLDLWHSKATPGAPGLRVNDFQIVVAQAVRSRSHYNDPALWTSLRERLMNRQSPNAYLVSGSDDLSRLLVLLGEQRPTFGRRLKSWPTQPPLTQGEICIAQPGLSRASLFAPESGQQTTAESLRQLFASFADTMSATGRRGRIVGSP